MAKAKSLDDVPAQKSKRPRPNEVVDMLELVNKKWNRIRPTPGVFMRGTHWVKTKRKDGSLTQFPFPCRAFDPNTGRVDSKVPCAWCKAGYEDIRTGTEVWNNVIARAIQKNGPSAPPKPTKAEARTGFKDKDSDTYTPYRAYQFPTTVLNKMRDFKSLNTHEDPETGETKGYSVDHPKFGCDINIYFDSSKDGAEKYNVQMGSHTPLTKAERGFLKYDLELLSDVPSEEEAASEFKAWKRRFYGDKEPKTSDEDEGMSKKKSRPVDDEDDDDLDLAPAKKRKARDEDEDDDDPPPKKKKKKSDDDDDDDDFDPPPKKKKKPVDDDDDDDDDDGDDDDDDSPPKKKKKKPADDDDDDDFEPPKKKKKKPVDDDDDDDDEDEEDEDEDDDDDPPPKKKKKKPVDDDDDDEDEEDEDEDDDPPPKKKKKVVKKPAKKPAAKKKKKPADDDDDDDDDD